VRSRLPKFLFAIIELFSLALTAVTLYSNTSKSPLLKGWVTFGLNIGLRVTFTASMPTPTVRWGNGSATTLPLEVFA